MAKSRSESTIVVIECPSCGTKFGVDSAVLGHVNRPRFHCSKCDTTFSKSLASLTTADPQRSRLKTLSVPQEPQEPEELRTFVGPSYHRVAPEVRPVPAASEGGRETGIAAPESLRAREIGIEASQSRAPLAVDEVQVPAPQPTPKVMSQPPRGTDPRGIISHGRVEEKSPSEGEPATVVRKSVDTSPVMSSSSETANAVSEVKLSVAPSRPVRANALSSNSVESSSVGSSSVESSGGDARRGSWWSALLHPRGPVQAFTIGLLPMVVIIMVIIGISLRIIQNPRSISIVNAALLDSQARVPPSDVQIEDATFRKQDLENGESIYVISGRLVNRAAHGFSRVEIQGITFDDLGRPLQKEVGAAGSVLTKARFGSLSTHTISDLQEGSLRKEARVRAGESVDFVVVVVPQSPPPTFFTARVYSVHESDR